MFGIPRSIILLATVILESALEREGSIDPPGMRMGVVRNCNRGAATGGLQLGESQIPGASRPDDRHADFATSAGLSAKPIGTQNGHVNPHPVVSTSYIRTHARITYTYCQSPDILCTSTGVEYIGWVYGSARWEGFGGSCLTLFFPAYVLGRDLVGHSSLGRTGASQTLILDCISYRRVKCSVLNRYLPRHNPSSSQRRHPTS